MQQALLPSCSAPSHRLCNTCRHSFGVAADAANGLHWLNENTLLYPVGHSIALCNTESTAQRFIQAAPESTGFSALALTPSRKYLAVGEQGEKGSVTIYDLASLKRRKVLVSSTATSKVRHSACTYAWVERCLLSSVHAQSPGS